MNEQIQKLVKEADQSLRADRRKIHQNPELSHQEIKTMEYITKRLDAIGIPYRSGIAGTGVLAEIQGSRPGKCLLIRADMDALPLQEKNQCSYASLNPGIMHACGHDAHTAILLNACAVFWELRENFCGSIKFAFQPGEETTGGAEPMILEGVMENPKVDACIALHVDPEIPVGKMQVQSGPMFASPDNFYITIQGKGGHGAQPHLTIDPILIAAQVVIQLQTIVSRSIDPVDKAVVTVGTIHAGDASNIIPDTARLEGTARSFSNEMREFLDERIHSIVKKTCEAYGAKYTYQFEKLYPPLCNHPEIAKQLLESGKRCLGEENCIWGGPPAMGGEDFAYFAQKAPSAMFRLGCRNEEKGITAPGHNPCFDIDEDCLAYGLSIFAESALDFLQE